MPGMSAAPALSTVSLKVTYKHCSMTDHINHLDYIRKGKERFHRATFGRSSGVIFKENLDGWIMKSKYSSKYFIKWGQWVTTKVIFYMLHTKKKCVEISRKV